jgi:DNA-binding response OmpR family regulator
MTPVPAPIRCLVVEDQALIGMAIEAYLEDIGCAVEPLASGAAALTWLAANTPDAAIIDFLLKDGPGIELARELKRRGVPFVIYSGHPRKSYIPADLQDVPWIEKPADRADLLGALAAVAPSFSDRNAPASGSIAFVRQPQLPSPPPVARPR